MLCLRRWIWSSMLTCRELRVEVFWCPGQKATICFGAYSVAIFMAVGSWAGGLWSSAHQPCQLRPNVRCISTLPGHSHHGSSADFICARSLVQTENHAALLLELASAVIWADSNASRLIDVKDNIVTCIIYSSNQLSLAWGTVGANFKVDVLEHNLFYYVLHWSCTRVAVKHLCCVLICLHSRGVVVVQCIGPTSILQAYQPWQKACGVSRSCPLFLRSLQSASLALGWQEQGGFLYSEEKDQKDT